MPVATRMSKAPRLSVPRNQVTRKASERLRILTEERCRKTFCWIESARCRLPVPDPLRKMERHTRVSRKFAMRASREFAISGPYELLSLQRSGTIHQQIALVVDIRAKPDQWARRRPFDFGPVAREFAAVTGTRHNPEVRIPSRQAAQVRAHGRHRVDSFRPVHDVK